MGDQAITAIDTGSAIAVAPQEALWDGGLRRAKRHRTWRQRQSATGTLATNTIAAVNGPTTDTAPVVVPILAQHRIITMCPCGNPQYDQTTGPYFWRLVPLSQWLNNSFVEANYDGFHHDRAGHAGESLVRPCRGRLLDPAGDPAGVR
jgi:hypothetical protein